MSYWQNLDTLIITTDFARGDLTEGAKNYIQCIDGSVAAFSYQGTDDDGRRMLQIYNASTGEDVPIAFVYVTPGIDLLQGLFKTGVIPTLDIFADKCQFLRVDYKSVAV